jgi:hypothetical protein
MSEATKLSGTALNSAAGPQGAGQEVRNHRTAASVQFTLFIAPVL